MWYEMIELTNLSLVSLMSTRGANWLDWDRNLDGRRPNDMSSNTCIIRVKSFWTFAGAKDHVDMESGKQLLFCEVNFPNPRSDFTDKAFARSTKTVGNKGKNMSNNNL